MIFLQFEGVGYLFLCIFKMERCRTAKDSIGLFRWQRNRIIAQGLIIGATSLISLIQGFRTKYAVLLI